MPDIPFHTSHTAPSDLTGGPPLVPPAEPGCTVAVPQGWRLAKGRAPRSPQTPPVLSLGYEENQGSSPSPRGAAQLVPLCSCFPALSTAVSQLLHLPPTGSPASRTHVLDEAFAQHLGTVQPGKGKEPQLEPSRPHPAPWKHIQAQGWDTVGLEVVEAGRAGGLWAGINTSSDPSCGQHVSKHTSVSVEQFARRMCVST